MEINHRVGRLKLIFTQRRTVSSAMLPSSSASPYAMALFEDPAATRDDLREAVTSLEELERTARRVLGGAHPLTKDIERHLQYARAALRARESPNA